MVFCPETHLVLGPCLKWCAYPRRPQFGQNRADPIRLSVIPDLSGEASWETGVGFATEPISALCLESANQPIVRSSIAYYTDAHANGNVDHSGAETAVERECLPEIEPRAVSWR